MPIKKVLIANRGEIALRIIRTCRKMGIGTVAVYSEVDRYAPYVAAADEAYFIGKAPASESYLNIERILSVAKQAKVDAIHPGYGFLAENADFAQAVQEAGITFIGPSAYSIGLMGDKLAAKKAVSRFNVPLVPGTQEPIEEVEQAKKIAQQIGFPVLIKAAAGGGGKGMRVVYNEEELPMHLERAMSEAQSAFGNPQVFIEKYLQNPKHIEVQILADQHGNVVHLFERECSIQRRHQKVIEEAPSPIMTPELREKITHAAINVAKACDYFNAGTVEFIVDENKNFYFLEMNTRLQVEHPVTEMITGLDLVELQIRIAQGEQLPFSQAEIPLQGHAIELRVYAEDPENQFLPDTGLLKVYRPCKGEGIRVDDGYRQGMQVTPYYDPMLSKLIVHAKTREEAIEKMLYAIEHYEIVGVKNTLSFGAYVMRHPVFKKGIYTTHFVEQYYDSKTLHSELSLEEEEALLLWAAYHYREAQPFEEITTSLWYQKR